MKVSLTWLKDYVPLGLTADKLSHRLTMAGLEVENIEQFNGDTVFEIEITPNRPDCLNVLGIAREMSVIFNKPLKLPKIKKLRFPAVKCDIEILDRAGCARYIGTVVRNVNVGPSPLWMQKRLNAVGLRPINNIVDIANFCLMETGQPLHAFDYDKLIGEKIVVRRSREGEKLVTLDGVERILNSNILVIADTKRPVAIAGVMGGAETGVTDKTKNILLESAYFDPVLIRQAVRSLGISTDSSYRFERGVDIQRVEQSTHRALNFICEMAGGDIVQHLDEFVSRRKTTKKIIEVSINYINSVLGAELTTSQCKTVLKKLGFQVTVKEKKLMHVEPPSVRDDIKRSVDIIEEVARMIGYDNLPVSLPKVGFSNILPDKNWTLKQQIRNVLQSQGYDEIITYTLTNTRLLEMTQLDTAAGVKLVNPLTQDHSLMRFHLLPGFLNAARSNFNRGQKDLRFYEIGKIYSSAGERDVIAFLAAGIRQEDWRNLKKESIDFYDIKGALVQVLSSLGIENADFVLDEENKIFAVSEGAKVILKGKNPLSAESILGFLGKINKTILKNWDIKLCDIYFVQMDLKNLLRLAKTQKQYQSISEYPSIVRDVSLAVKKNMSFAQIEDVACKEGGKFLVDIRFIEQYLGEKIPSGYRGLIFSLVYRSVDRTLTEEEISKIHAQVVQKLVENFQAIIR